MSKFKVGDKVIYLHHKEKILTVNEIYKGDCDIIYKCSYKGIECGFFLETDLAPASENSISEFKFTVKINTDKRLVEVYLADVNGNVVAMAHGHILDRGKNFTDGMSIEQRVAQAFSFAAHRLQMQLK